MTFTRKGVYKPPLYFGRYYPSIGLYLLDMMQTGMESRSATDELVDNGSREPNDTLQTVLELLSDPDCRLLLGAASEPRTTSELADVCDVPLSTAYRKVDRLSETPLLSEQLRFCSDGDHASEYVCTVDELNIGVIGNGVEVTVKPTEQHEESPSMFSVTPISAD